jgi:uncharacterized protein YdhG (YjbR/CyaY superfamily)
MSKRGEVAETVDEYIASAPEYSRRTLRELRKTIKDAAPKAEEVISYQMPAYKHFGILVYFAAFKDHMSLFVPGISESKKFKSRLKEFRVSGATIHFTADEPIPKSLVKDIVKMRVKENEMRAKIKR